MSSSLNLSNLSEDVRRLNQDILNTPSAKARARSPIPSMTFRSKTEERAWREWVTRQGAVRCLYEPLSFRMSSGNYKPDFMLTFADGSMWFVECKGSWSAYQSGRSSKRNLKQAATEFGWLGRWFALLPDKRGWKLEEFS